VLRYLCESNAALQNKIMSDLGDLAATAGQELLRSHIFKEQFRIEEDSDKGELTFSFVS
jgi:hypothetical protein